MKLLILMVITISFYTYLKFKRMKKTENDSMMENKSHKKYTLKEKIFFFSKISILYFILSTLLSAIYISTSIGLKDWDLGFVLLLSIPLTVILSLITTMMLP